jgi:excisionase family DNA binding protein
MGRLPNHARPPIRIHSPTSRNGGGAAAALRHENSDHLAPQARTDPSVTTAEPTWITPREAAVYLGVGVDTIYEACAASDLKHVKLGYRTIRLRREWVDAWAERHATPSD